MNKFPDYSEDIEFYGELGEDWDSGELIVTKISKNINDLDQKNNRIVCTTSKCPNILASDIVVGKNVDWRPYTGEFYGWDNLDNGEQLEYYVTYKDGKFIKQEYD